MTADNYYVGTLIFDTFIIAFLSLSFLPYHALIFLILFHSSSFTSLRSSLLPIPLRLPILLDIPIQLSLPSLSPPSLQPPPHRPLHLPSSPHLARLTSTSSLGFLQELWLPILSRGLWCSVQPYLDLGRQASDAGDVDPAAAAQTLAIAALSNALQLCGNDTSAAL